MEDFAKLIGQIVLFGGGAVGIAYAALKWFGKKWFENQFAQSLEMFKREQTEILEQFRYKINTRFNRVTKIHEKEFEVLPKLWKKLHDTYDYFYDIASPLQQFPNLDHFSPEELEAFIEKCGLEDYQSEELRNTDKKLDYYKEKRYWKLVNEADKKFREFRLYLRYNKIFLSSDLFGKFSEIEHILIETIVALENPEDGPWKENRNTYKKLRDEVKDLLSDLESMVQKRLHFDNG